jgi:hypothetical protein
MTAEPESLNPSSLPAPDEPATAPDAPVDAPAAAGPDPDPDEGAAGFPGDEAPRREAACEECAAPMAQQLFEGLGVWWPKACPECDCRRAEAMAREAALALMREREASLRAEIPPLYRKLAAGLLAGAAPDSPRFPGHAWAARLATWWPADEGSGSPRAFLGRGLVLAGPTGAWKTTMAVSILMRVHRSMGWSVCYLPAPDFGEAAQAKAGGDTAQAKAEGRAVLERAKAAGLLLLDDLGKQASTPTVEKELKRLVEWRCSRLRPIIATTQHTAVELESMLGRSDLDTGLAIVRRLQDYCEMVPCVG